jgi:hypothetical protein
MENIWGLKVWGGWGPRIWTLLHFQGSLQQIPGALGPFPRGVVTWKLSMAGPDSPFPTKETSAHL